MYRLECLASSTDRCQDIVAPALVAALRTSESCTFEVQVALAKLSSICPKSGKERESVEMLRATFVGPSGAVEVTRSKPANV